MTDETNLEIFPADDDFIFFSSDYHSTMPTPSNGIDVKYVIGSDKHASFDVSTGASISSPGHIFNINDFHWPNEHHTDFSDFVGHVSDLVNWDEGTTPAPIPERALAELPLLVDDSGAYIPHDHCLLI